MDLASDILRLAEKVSQVPGLSAACSLAMQIMRTVQISKNNTARLQYLAHSVADHLVSIAEQMEGKWDDATDNLKSQIDGFNAVLQDITKVVIKYSKSSPVVAFMNAGDRDMAIQRLERRLADTRTSILVLLGVDASISLRNIETGVDRFTRALESQAFRTQSQLQSFGNRFDQVQVSLRSRVEDTYSRVVRLEDVIQGHAAQASYQTVGDTGLPLYNMHELRILRTISRGYMHLQKNVTVTLREAQRRTNGQVVLVRSFEGSDPKENTKMFTRDLSRRTNIWEPNILLLVGASTTTSPMLFQVYDAPGGQVEGFLDWVRRTAAANPVETICGLYDMRTSLKALLEFETSRNVNCRMLFFDSVVIVRTNGHRLSWALIHTGEIEHGSNIEHSGHRRPGDFIGDIQAFLAGQHCLHLAPDILLSYRSRKTPGESVVNTFRQGSETWAEGVPDLDILFNHGIPNMDTTTLGSILLENGWLGPSRHYGLSHSPTVGLGDVGYMTEDHHFVAVSNFHSLLISTDGGDLTWEVEPYHGPDLSQNDVLERSGKSYKRYENQERSWSCGTLEYVNLDEKHAWKVLRGHACAIVVRHALAVSPHDLRLVISVTQCCSFMTHYLQSSEDEAAKLDGESSTAENAFEERQVRCETFSELCSDGINPMCLDQPRTQNSNDTETQSGMVPESGTDTHGELFSMSFTQSHIDEHSSPLYYVFADTPVHVRDSGGPELSPRARASFQADPEWLDDDEPFLGECGIPNFDSKKVETQNGYGLLKRFECYIDSLQLPVGVALPYVEELGDP